MQLIEKIKATSSRTYKAVLLEEATNIEKRVFKYAYDPAYVYGLNKFSSIDERTFQEPEESLFELLDKLSNNELTGDAARSAVEIYAGEHGDLIKHIVQKNLQMGVSAKTISKIYPGLVHLHPTMMKAKEMPFSAIVFPAIAQIKYNGVRLIMICRNKKVTCLTYNGKSVNIPAFQDAIDNSPVDNFVLDGELCYRDGKNIYRTSISGATNSAIHGGSMDLDNVAFNVFDHLTLDEYDTEICTTKYTERFKRKMFILTALRHDNIVPAISVPVNNVQMVEDLYEELVAGGYEGLVVKMPEHFYEFKRSKDWIKLKEVRTADLLCYGADYGQNKYAEMIGALNLFGTVEGKDVKVSVGSGLSDDERDHAIDYYNGKTIEVKYNEVIESVEHPGYHTLFLPRFDMVRFDK